jgi:aminotransferase
VITDEVYGNMLYGQAGLYSPAQDGTFHRRVVRIMSFSKDFCLTGWRIGFLHSDRTLIDQILPVHDTLVNCAPVISQRAAEVALHIADEVFTLNRVAYKKQKSAMESYLDAMPYAFSYIPPQGGYFLFPRLLPEISAETFCYDVLEKAGVIAVPGNDFGPGGERHIRLCFGRSLNDIHHGMQRLQKYVEETYEA